MPILLIAISILFLFIVPVQYDIKNRRTFLKKHEYPGVAVDNLFIGATLTVYSRQLKVIDFADKFTRESLSSRLSTYASTNPLHSQSMTHPSR